MINLNFVSPVLAAQNTTVDIKTGVTGFFGWMFAMDAKSAMSTRGFPSSALPRAATVEPALHIDPDNIRVRWTTIQALRGGFSRAKCVR